MEISEFVKTYKKDKIKEFEVLKEATERSELDITDKTAEEYAKHRLIKDGDIGYEQHLSFDEIQEGLRNKELVQGVVKKIVRKNKRQTGFIERIGVDKHDIIIEGIVNINRAIVGDTVVVKIIGNEEESKEDEDRERILEAEGDGDEDQDEDQDLGEWMEFADDLDDEGDSGKSIEKDKGGEQFLSLKNNPQAQEAVRGRVVGIVKREWRPIVAMVQEDDTKGSFHIAVPVNENIPKIRISCSNVDEIIGNRIVVVIDKWAIHSQYPDGHIISKLGKAGEVNTEIDTLLIEHGIAASQQDLAFPQVVMDDLPKPWDAVAEKGRRDIRDRVVFSIDPIGSQDIDDALSIEKTKTGYELGVHIADASYFVKPGNKIDEEAKKRTSTIYLPDRRFNMIPELLSEQLCSLRGGKDRYAVSVLWNLDNKYQVKDIWFGRTLINSKCEMSYEFAQSLLDENEAYQKELMNNSDSAKDTTLQYITVANVSKDMISVLKSRVEMLTALMRHFRGIRLNNGGLQLESVEVKFKYKQNQIYEIEPKKKLEIHSVIEEAMIMANVAVAERIFQHFNKTSLLRSHGFPTQERFDTLKLMAESVGIGIDTESNLKLAESLARAEKIARDKFHDGSVAKLLKSITVLAMQEAKYVCSGNDQQFVSGNKGGEYYHYGLAVPIYTHFTSPIRRYSDIIVHRQLLEAVKYGSNDVNSGEYSKLLYDHNYITKITDLLNSKTKAYKIIQRESTGLFQTIFLTQLLLLRQQNKPNTVSNSDTFEGNEGGNEFLSFDGMISGIKENRVNVYISTLGLTGTVYIKRKDPFNDYGIPLSVFTRDLAHCNTMIFGCKMLELDTNHIKLQLPSSITSNIINNDNSRDDDGGGGGSGSVGSNGVQSRVNLEQYANKIFTISVFEHVKVIVKSRKSKYRLPQVYFMLVYKSKEVFDSKQRKNTRILPLGVGRYNDEEKVKTAINALNTQFMDLKVSNSEKIVGNFGSCSGTDYGIGELIKKDFGNTGKISSNSKTAIAITNAKTKTKTKTNSLYNITEISKSEKLKKFRISGYI